MYFSPVISFNLPISPQHARLQQPDVFTTEKDAKFLSYKTSRNKVFTSVRLAQNLICFYFLCDVIPLCECRFQILELHHTLEARQVLELQE